MRLVFIALLLGAPAARAADKVGIQVEFGIGPVWALTEKCRYYGCPSAVGVSLRAGYALSDVASIGLRASAALGPEGIGTPCGAGSSCERFGGYRAASLLIDGRVHTDGIVQLVGGAGIGVGRLIRLQCNCTEEYDTHGSGLAVLDFAVGLRIPFYPGVYGSIEGNYSAMFNAESAGSTGLGTPLPQTGLIVSSIGVAFKLGASL